MSGKRVAPVACYIPAADAARLRMLSGEPQVSGTVYDQSASDVGNYCAAMLWGLEPSARRDALRIIHAEADNMREKVPMVPIAPLLPQVKSSRALVPIVNGMHLTLLGVGSCDPNTSVGTAMAHAASMAKGMPLASDPASGERQNEVLLAKAILEAALLGSERAKEWFRNNNLSEFLDQVEATAKYGTVDSDPSNTAAADVERFLYDCYKHAEPLGGDVLAGSVSSLLNSAWSAAKKGVTEAAANALAKQVGKRVTDVEAEQEASEDGDAATLSPEAAAEASKAVTDGTTDLAAQISAAKAALKEAQSKIDSSQQNMSEYRENLRKAAKEMAKLNWASQILQAPDEVAEILTATNPNMADVGTFIQTCLSALPAAKATGSLSTVKALIQALKSAVSKGDGSVDTLYSLISGEPAGVEEAAENSLASSRLIGLIRKGRAAAVRVSQEGGE